MMIERKEEVVLWFRQLESYKRIDAMCTLLQMCLPFELRFLGTYLEELGSRDSQELRGIELRVNNPTDLAQEITACQLGEPTDQRIRRKMALYLALIRTSNRKCCNELFKTLFNWGDKDLSGGNTGGKVTMDTLFQELLLVYTMAQHHPVFSFEQRSKCAEILGQLLIKHAATNMEYGGAMSSPSSSPSPSPSSIDYHLMQHHQQQFPHVHPSHPQMGQIPNLQQPPPQPQPGQSFLIAANAAPGGPFPDQQTTNPQQQQHLIQLQQQQQAQFQPQHIHPHHQMMYNQNQPLSLEHQFPIAAQPGTIYHEYQPQHSIGNWPHHYRHHNATVDTSIPPPQILQPSASQSSSPVMSSSPNTSRTGSPIRGLNSSTSSGQSVVGTGHGSVRSNASSSGNMGGGGDGRGAGSVQQQQHLTGRRTSRRPSGDQATPPPHLQQVEDQQQQQQFQTAETYSRNGYPRQMMSQGRHSKHYVPFQQQPQVMQNSFHHMQQPNYMPLPPNMFPAQGFVDISYKPGGSESGGSNSNDDMSPPDTPPALQQQQQGFVLASSVQQRLLNQQNRVSNQGGNGNRLDKSNLIQLQLASGAVPGTNYILVNSNPSPNSTSNNSNNSDSNNGSGAGGNLMSASPTPMASAAQGVTAYQLPAGKSYRHQQNPAMMHSEMVGQPPSEIEVYPYQQHFHHHPHSTLITTGQIASPPPAMIPLFPQNLINYSLHTLPVQQQPQQQPPQGVSGGGTVTGPPPFQQQSQPQTQQQSQQPTTAANQTKSCFNCGSQQHNGLECKETSMEDAIRHSNYKLDFNSQTAASDIMEENSETEENPSSSSSPASSRGSSSCSTTNNNVSETEKTIATTTVTGTTTAPGGIISNSSSISGNRSLSSRRINSFSPNISSTSSSNSNVTEISQSLSNLGLASQTTDNEIVNQQQQQESSGSSSSNLTINLRDSHLYQQSAPSSTANKF